MPTGFPKKMNSYFSFTVNAATSGQPSPKAFQAGTSGINQN
jgi:hypothetical protein